MKDKTTCVACKTVAHRMFFAGRGEWVLCGNCAQVAMDECDGTGYNEIDSRGSKVAKMTKPITKAELEEWQRKTDAALAPCDGSDIEQMRSDIVWAEFMRAAREAMPRLLARVAEQDRILGGWVEAEDRAAEIGGLYELIEKLEGMALIAPRLRDKLTAEVERLDRMQEIVTEVIALGHTEVCHSFGTDNRPCNCHIGTVVEMLEA